MSISIKRWLEELDVLPNIKEIVKQCFGEEIEQFKVSYGEYVNSVHVYCVDYVIAHILVSEEGVYLHNHFTGSANKTKSSIVKLKLKHEFEDLYSSIEKNEKYIFRNHKSKLMDSIDIAFFRNYLKYIKNKIKTTLVDYDERFGEFDTKEEFKTLEIKTESNFDLNELALFINRLNDLYVIFSFINNYEIEEINQITNYCIENNIELSSYLLKEYKLHSLVLEKISIASSGLVSAVGIALIVELIKDLIYSVAKKSLNRLVYEGKTEKISSEIKKLGDIDEEYIINIKKEVAEIKSIYKQIDNCTNKTSKYLEDILFQKSLDLNRYGSIYSIDIRL